MSDPAVEAAQRAWAQIDYNDATFDLLDPECAELVTVARETLKPVQKLHKPVRVYAHPDAGEECLTCKTGWPCKTAKLIYPENELPND